MQIVKREVIKREGGKMGSVERKHTHIDISL